MAIGFPWQCPYCRRHATITGADYGVRTVGLANDGKDGPQVVGISLTTCPNPNCRKYQLEAWLYAGKEGPYRGGDPVAANAKATRYWPLVPDVTAAAFPDFVPQQIRDDYGEACRIVALSAKAAATLARRCLQGMIRDVWKVKKRNLAVAIEAIRKKVDPEAWRAIDGVRTVGNIGAHMEKDVNLIIPVDPQEADALIRLIEALIEDWYIKPRERQALYAKVSTVAANKSNARKRELSPGQPATAPPGPQVGKSSHVSADVPAAEPSEKPAGDQ